MTDLEEHFRTLDRLPSPDLWPEAERRRPGRGPMPRRASRLAPAAVALAAAVLGIGLVVRAFAFGPAEGPGAVNPTTSTTPNVTRCTQATTSGDFDGDGTTDTATFIEVASGDVSCDHSGAVVEHLTSQELMVAFGSGQALEQRFTDCQGGLCAYVFAATDLDGDGRDELAVDVSSGGAIGLVEFYRVGLDGARPLTVADPGDPPYVQPGPAIIGGGFDSAAQSPTACRVNADGTRELVSTHAELAGGSVGGQWQVHTTTMVLSGDELAVTSTKDTTSTFSMTSEIFRNGCATGGSGTPTPNPSTSGSAPPPSGSIIYVAHDARGVSVQIQDLSSGSVRTVSRHST